MAWASEKSKMWAKTKAMSGIMPNCDANPVRTDFRAPLATRRKSEIESVAPRPKLNARISNPNATSNNIPSPS